MPVTPCQPPPNVAKGTFLLHHLLPIWIWHVSCNVPLRPMMGSLNQWDCQ